MVFFLYLQLYSRNGSANFYYFTCLKILARVTLHGDAEGNSGIMITHDMGEEEKLNFKLNSLVNTVAGTIYRHPSLSEFRPSMPGRVL